MAKSKNYEVGYSKPPEAGQWKKGQSGNPSGKKKAGNEAPPKPFLHCIAAQLSEKVEITSQGKKTQITFADAFGKKLMHDLMAAPMKDKIKAIETLAKLGVFSFQSALADGLPEEDWCTEEDRRIIAAIAGDEEN